MADHRVEMVMGTAISVDVRQPGVGDRGLDAVFAWFRRVDEVYSTYKEDSQISRLGRGEILLDGCDPDVADVLARCDDVRRASGGAFDAWATGVLDPSGLVKGWSVEQASALLLERGGVNHCINAGGDIKVRGEAEVGRPWRLGIAHPFQRDALTVVVEGRDLAVATSGMSERGPHVVDPRSGRPAVDLASVTVVGDDLTLADGYATAAVAKGLDAPDWLATLAETTGYRAYVIDAGDHVWWTTGFGQYAPALTEFPRPQLLARR